jgi:DNA-binding MarR family transcriptional regulator
MPRNQTKTAPDDKCYRLWTLMLQTTHLMSRRRENELRAFGLRRMESAILHVLLLSENPPTISELSRLIVREPHTVGTLVYRMEKKHLLRIDHDVKRKNLKRLILTDKGKALAEQTIKIPSIVETMSCLSEEDQTRLRKFLRIIRSRLLDDLKMSHRFPKSSRL